MKVVPIVEGHGEVGAVPVLVRRLAQEFHPDQHVDVERPIRVRRSKLQSEGELERAVSFAALKSEPDDIILVLVDADDDCPAKLGPALLERCRRVRADRRVSVVLANREFENWFIAAIESLAGHRGLLPGLVPPDDPESIRGAKEWLRDRCTADQRYRPTIDQAAFIQRMDLHAALRSPSFAKLHRDLATLFRGS